MDVEADMRECFAKTASMVHFIAMVMLMIQDKAANPCCYFV